MEAGKQAVREDVWDALEREGVARFPFPPHGRIPNFAGADAAAERLAETDEWRSAGVVKANPDSPQLPVRRRALREGKTVYMAVPRLRDEKCFILLDPDEIDDVDGATTVSGSVDAGVQVAPEEMEPVDLIVSGSVAVNTKGARIGKGEGYSDLEFAVLREFDLVDDETTTVTTVHEIQLFDEDVPTTPRDVPIDLIFTPEKTVRCEGPGRKPRGIDWDSLGEDRYREIPILDRLKPPGY